MHLMQPTLETSVTRTLVLALSTIGNLERLAQHLGVDPQQIEQWIQGQGRPPTPIYMKALDLVASGPFSRRL